MGLVFSETGGISAKSEYAVLKIRSAAICSLPECPPEQIFGLGTGGVYHIFTIHHSLIHKKMCPLCNRIHRLIFHTFKMAERALVKPGF